MRYKLFIILLVSLLASFAGFSQTANTVSAKTLNATVHIYLATTRIDSITNDPNLLSNSPNMVPTEAAVVAYFKNAPLRNIYASNGLTALNDSTLQWGGRLIKSTTMSAAGQSLTMDSLSSFFMKLLPSKSVGLSTDSMLIKDISGKVWVTAIPAGGASTIIQGTTNQINQSLSGSTYTLSLPSTVHLAGSIDVGSTSAIQWGDGGGISGSTNGFLQATGNGIFLISNAAANDFARLILGGSTSSYPAIARNGAGVDIKLGDNSAYASIQALSFVKNGGTSSQILMADGSVTSPYSLPTATTSVLGGVKVDGITITALAGVISAVSSSSLLTRQVLTSNSTSVTFGGANYLMTIDLSSYDTLLVITLPPSPTDQQIARIEAGGTISGGVEVTTLSIVPNSGQAIIQAIAPTTINAGEVIEYQYRASNTTWYRHLGSEWWFIVFVIFPTLVKRKTNFYEISTSAVKSPK